MTHEADSNDAGYIEAMVDGKAYGEVLFGRLAIWSLVSVSSASTLTAATNWLSALQQEASLAVLNRSMSGVDIATGEIVDISNNKQASEVSHSTTHTADLEMVECDTGLQARGSWAETMF